jgi:hypothetical protein
MAKLIYLAIASLDDYVADEDGNYDWAVPDEEVHAFINDLERPVGTHLYGRRMYDTMVGWETDPTLADRSSLMRDFAEIWQAADKVVYSKTLEAVSTARTRIERDFDPEAVRQMKALARPHRGRSRARRPGVQGRVGRRVTPVRSTDGGGRRQAVPARQRPPEASTAGRTPFRQRHGLPLLPHQEDAMRCL